MPENNNNLLTSHDFRKISFFYGPIGVARSGTGRAPWGGGGDGRLAGLFCLYFDHAFGQFEWGFENVRRLCYAGLSLVDAMPEFDIG